MYDLCATLPDDDVLCDSLAEYAQACREAGGSPGDWRAETTQCGEYLISYYESCVCMTCVSLMICYLIVWQSMLRFVGN